VWGGHARGGRNGRERDGGVVGLGRGFLASEQGLATIRRRGGKCSTMGGWAQAGGCKGSEEQRVGGDSSHSCARANGSRRCGRSLGLLSKQGSKGEKSDRR